MKKPKKLTKTQLKKLKGGLIACMRTRCIIGPGAQTCAQQDNSREECKANPDQTVELQPNDSGGITYKK